MYPGRQMYPGSFNLSRQTPVSGHPGSANYPGRDASAIRALQSILAAGHEVYPGKLGTESIRAAWPENLSGQHDTKSIRANKQSNLSRRMQPIHAQWPIQADTTL